MAGITLAQAEAKLDTYMAAADAVATGQSYDINGVSMTRANLTEIHNAIKFWDGQVKRLGKGGVRVNQITPVSN